MGRIRGDLVGRTTRFALSVLEIVDELPEGTKGWELGRQLVRSGTSIGANVREADHAISEAEFAHRCSIARKEASETSYWLHLCCESGLLSNETATTAIQESDELVSILASLVKRTQAHLAR